jgi:folate-binding protein YgfZ
VTVTTEYELLTEDAGALRRPGRAVILLEGAEAREFLQGQLTNDIEALESGHGCYAALLDHKGKLRTDMRVLRTAADALQVDCDPLGRAALMHTFQTYSLGRDVRTRDVTEEHALLSVLGPVADRALDATPGPEEHAHVEGEHGRYARTDLGIDLFVAAAEVDAVAEAMGLTSVSEDAAECVRIESGRPRLGVDMDSSTMPQEAGINERAVSFTKGCYVGQETVARLHYRGRPNRHLRGLRLDAPAQRGDAVKLGDRQVGTVSSACESPVRGPLALALIRKEAEPGQPVTVGGRPATVVELPFGDA